MWTVVVAIGVHFSMTVAAEMVAQFSRTVPPLLEKHIDPVAVACLEVRSARILVDYSDLVMIVSTALGIYLV